ncbi:MAG TPA: hypothetical protein VII94_06220 [Candidatus Saccharimonadales bacterium]
MIVYEDCKKFKVMGRNCSLYSEETAYGLNTVVEMDGRYLYLGKELPHIAAAILAWQMVNAHELTNEELRQVLMENHLIFEGI